MSYQNLRDKLNQVEDGLYELRQSEAAVAEQARLLDLAKGKKDSAKEKFELALADAETPNFTKRQIKQLVEDRLSAMVESGFVKIVPNTEEVDTSVETVAAKPKQTRTRRGSTEDKPSAEVSSNQNVTNNDASPDPTLDPVMASLATMPFAEDKVEEHSEITPVEVTPLATEVEIDGEPEVVDQGEQAEEDDDDMSLDLTSAHVPVSRPAAAPAGAPAFLAQRSNSIPVPSFGRKS